MEVKELIEQAEENIRTALDDYGKHIYNNEILEDVSDEFIEKLAKDSVLAKQKLRNLFSQSPVWDSKLDAMIINGTRTANPDYDVIYNIGCRILGPAVNANKIGSTDAISIVEFFSTPSLPEATKQVKIELINSIAPKAYAPGKKLSRVFKAICKALDLSDETAGSEFQKLYAQFADELSARKINYKLYVSINPAHFITMSNPKSDERGTTLTSCHSFNSTEYQYNNGCSGYARDETSFIVFTVSDPSDPETLNNRKTSRQIFAYKPGNGLLLQSRFYNTRGGTRGAVEESAVYRDLIQREISYLEDKPNLWKTYPYLGRDKEYCVKHGEGFGGYPDWEYEGFEGKVSIRDDKKGTFEPIEIGTWGLCIKCACETNEGLYCEDCQPDENRCEYCDEYTSEELTTAYDRNNNEVEVCEQCLHEHFSRCENCEEYIHNDNLRYVEDISAYYCEDCLGEYCFTCEDCDEIYARDNAYLVFASNGYERYVCESCRDSNYRHCEHCGNYVEDDGSNECPCCGACTKPEPEYEPDIFLD